MRRKQQIKNDAVQAQKVQPPVAEMLGNLPGPHMNTSSLVQKVWNFCHTLKDDGVGYGDYLEQLTYLLFLKLAHEYAQEPYNRDTHIPNGYGWASLTSKVGEPLEAHYLATLHRLGQEPGMLGAIFFKAQNKIQDPAKLSRLVQLIDAESWISLDADTKGDLYEGLLQKNAEDTKRDRKSVV